MEDGTDIKTKRLERQQRYNKILFQCFPQKDHPSIPSSGIIRINL